MKRTTIAIEAEILRQIKLRAARRDASLQDTVNELLRRGLAAPARTGFKLELESWDGVQDSSVDLFDRDSIQNALERNR